MLSTMHAEVVQGILVPEAVLHSSAFAVLAAFVALNTMMYGALSLAKVLPKIYVMDWISGPNRRTESRSIHPAPSRDAASDPATTESTRGSGTPFEAAA
jgi:hypothetical protein